MPVAISHGTAMIAMIYVIRPSLIRGQHYHSRSGLLHPSTKNALSVARSAQSIGSTLAASLKTLGLNTLVESV
jgi:hypothetical protein